MNVLLWVTTVICGWLAGGVSNWMADALPWRNRAGADADAGAVQTVGRRAFLPRRPRTVDDPAARRHARRAWAVLASMVAGYVIAAALFAETPLTLLLLWLYTLFLVTVTVIDYEHHRVLNVMLGTAAVVALLVSVLPQTPDPARALLGGLCGFGIFLLLAVISRGKMGAGDVKFAGVIGLMVGYPAVVYALLAGIFLGGAAALILLISRRATRKSAMAYAPYLAMGTLLTLWLAGLMT